MLTISRQSGVSDCSLLMYTQGRKRKESVNRQNKVKAINHGKIFSIARVFLFILNVTHNCQTAETVKSVRVTRKL